MHNEAHIPDNNPKRDEGSLSNQTENPHNAYYSSADLLRGAGITLPQGYRGRLSSPCVIAIDGPLGAGKSSVAKLLAIYYGVPYLNSGGLYRALALKVKDAKIDLDNLIPETKDKIVELAKSLSVEFFLERDTALIHKINFRAISQGKDITKEMHTEENSLMSSKVSAIPEVRKAIMITEKIMAQGGCVAEGRDMGTSVFPNARYKVFLSANITTRAERRLRQILGLSSRQELTDSHKKLLDDIRDNLTDRDQRDSTREASPLRKATDAIEIDCSNISLKEIVEQLIESINSSEEKLKG
ncbi:MAG: (d)CMP kinase [Bdellovibrionales bacterium]|nr:(d)CMP kinase [Bdellovibrionales bacterium]